MKLYPAVPRYWVWFFVWPLFSFRDIQMVSLRISQVLIGVAESAHLLFFTSFMGLWSPLEGLSHSTGVFLNLCCFLWLRLSCFFPAEHVGKDLNASCDCIKFILGTKIWGLPSSPIYSLLQKNLEDLRGAHSLVLHDRCFSYWQEMCCALNSCLGDFGRRMKCPPSPQWHPQCPAVPLLSLSCDIL